MEINTASALISFHSKLEDQTAAFYNSLAVYNKFSNGRETFLAFAKENAKHKNRVLRTYREIISDAMETGFFTGMEDTDYVIDTEIPETATYSQILHKALEIEETAYHFCRHASTMSRSLLASIPQAFDYIAKKKADRQRILKSLLV